MPHPGSRNRSPISGFRSSGFRVPGFELWVSDLGCLVGLHGAGFIYVCSFDGLFTCVHFTVYSPVQRVVIKFTGVAFLGYRPMQHIHPFIVHGVFTRVAFRGLFPRVAFRGLFTRVAFRGLFTRVAFRGHVPGRSSLRL